MQIVVFANVKGLVAALQRELNNLGTCQFFQNYSDLPKALSGEKKDRVICQSSISKAFDGAVLARQLILKKYQVILLMQGDPTSGQVPNELGFPVINVKSMSFKKVAVKVREIITKSN